MRIESCHDGMRACHAHQRIAIRCGTGGNRSAIGDGAQDIAIAVAAPETATTRPARTGPANEVTPLSSLLNSLG